MTRRISGLFVPAATLFVAIALPALAALKPGTPAPDFTTAASLGGKEFQFTLSDALKKGPVVLYFYPAAFSTGCTIEAHDFAEATEKFEALGATVIGVSHDDIATLDKFSVTDCRSKFAVAADPDLKIIKSYDAKLPMVGYADRTSFVIVPDGTVSYVYSALNPEQHVSNTLAAVQEWRDKHPRK
jgi:peroxiredoxin